MPARATVWAAALGLTCLACLAADRDWADQFKMTLHVQAGQQKQDGAVDEQPTQAPRGQRRPALHVKAGELIRARWRVQCSAHAKVADVLVHFFVAGEKEAGDMSPPDLRRENVVVESALTQDFDPKDTASSLTPFRIDQPGVYRVQIETRTTSGNFLAEDQATLDVVVEGTDGDQP